MTYPADFLAICRRTGRDPKEFRDREAVERYLRAWYRAG